MKRVAIVCAFLAVSHALPMAAGDAAAAKSKFSFTDPAGDVTITEYDPNPIDVVGIDVSSDGEFIVVSSTLAAIPKPTALTQALITGVAFDADNDVKTGGHGFAGMHGPLPGIDFESEIFASVDEGQPSKSASASVIGVDANGNQSSVLYSFDAPSTDAKGKVFTGKIAYSSIGVKPGQTIRMIVRELNDGGETAGMFPELLLKLK
jgi:hypothetical protein